MIFEAPVQLAPACRHTSYVVAPLTEPQFTVMLVCPTPLNVGAAGAPGTAHVHAVIVHDGVDV